MISKISLAVLSSAEKENCPYPTADIFRVKATIRKAEIFII
jgi:hypothetical protein